MKEIAGGMGILPEFQLFSRKSWTPNTTLLYSLKWIILGYNNAYGYLHLGKRDICTCEEKGFDFS